MAKVRSDPRLMQKVYNSHWQGLLVTHKGMERVVLTRQRRAALLSLVGVLLTVCETYSNMNVDSYKHVYTPNLNTQT